MYNKNLKQAYLEFKNDEDNNTILSVFNSLKLIEEEHDQDIMNIPMEIIGEFLLKKSPMTYSSFKVKMFIIQAYKEWGLKNGLISHGEAPFVATKIVNKEYRDLYNKYNRLKIFRSPLELKNVLDIVTHNIFTDGITIDDILRVYIELVYQGLTEEEISQIKLEDLLIAKDSIAIKINDRIIMIYTEFVSDIKKIYTHRIYIRRYNFTNTYESINSNYLVNTNNNLTNKELKKLIRTALRNRSKFIPGDYNLKIKDIYIAGVLYNLLQTKKIEDIKRSELVKLCYQESNPNPNKRDRVYSILENW